MLDHRPSARTPCAAGLALALVLMAPPAMGEAVDVPRVERGQLVLEGIPEVPQRIADDLRRYQSTRSAGFRGWHPEGRGILITTRFGDTNQIHWVESPGGTRRQLTFFQEPVPTALPSPAAASSGFLYARDVGGSEYFQIFYYDFATGESRLLTDGASRNGSPSWDADGSRFAFFSTARNGRDWDVLIGTPDGKRTTVLEANGAYIPGDFSPDGRFLIVTRLVSVRENHPALLDLESGELTPLHEGDAAVSNAFRFTPDGKELYFASNKDGEFRKLYRRHLETGSVETLSDSIGWDIESVVLSPDGSKLAFTINENGSSRLFLKDTETFKDLPLPALPTGRIRALAFRPDGQHLGFEMERPSQSGDAYSIDLDATRLVRWTFSENAGLPEDHFVEPELIHYPTFDTVDGGGPRQIPAIYYKPPGDGPHPVIIRIHGGPEGQSRPGFDANLQYWVRELGAAVILPNVRGSSGYGRNYLQLDNGFLREDSVKDIGSLLDWIAEQPQLDSDRVAVYGASYGGYMVLASMIHYGDRLRAGVDIVGISNFVTFLTNTKDYRRDLRRVEYGDERDPAMRAHLEKISPTARASELTKPLLIGQGLNDPRVPASESEQMVAEIRKAGGDVWYFLAKDEGHGFRKRPNRDAFQAAVVLFLEKHLLQPAAE
ncbi:MAG: prolyl oligopeptidase family serine peptidase [Acidobacteriota bacterium]